MYVTMLIFEKEIHLNVKFKYKQKSVRPYSLTQRNYGINVVGYFQKAIQISQWLFKECAKKSQFLLSNNLLVMLIEAWLLPVNASYMIELFLAL